ncbi:MAG: phosphate ABC transporter permease subunit PstC [Phycisphaeraceae bacterium]
MTPPATTQPEPLGKLGTPRSKAIRDLRERAIMASLVGCGVITLGITLGIVFILIRETIGFFGLIDEDGQAMVTVRDFLFGLEWNPLLGQEKHFGIWPLILGTLKVTIVAMAFALPVGLIAAVWLSEYAKPRVRAWIKPILEVLAGIPTVVFGFFAVSFITPVLLQWEWLQVKARDANGDVLINAAGQPVMQAFNPLNFGSYNVMAAGLAVGVMCLPIVTSLTEDALRAVPRALREGSYGLGANKFETSVKVVVPAALSGVMAAFLLAIARAVGETMIVALAAGKQAIQLLTPSDDPKGGETFDVGNAVALNEPVQPMTGFIVSMFTGDVRVGSVEYYSSYAVAGTLFVMTLTITVVGNMIQKRFREKYD